MSTFLYPVGRQCPEGLCPANDGGPCSCLDPFVHVDVDELTEDEQEDVRRSGTDEQRAELEAWLARDPGELLAGQPDRFPELRRS